MIPKRYLFASMFIAAMLMLVAFVQAPRPIREGGAMAQEMPVELSMASFETIAEYRLEEGWAPRFQGAQDPDQDQPWPYGGGFGTPWEPASAYLADQGLAINGPDGNSEVVLRQGLEWRHYRFDAPLASARLDPGKGNRLLVTLMFGPRRFETRLLEVPEGRVLWAADSGPWSRFSWDGRAVLMGLRRPGPDPALLLTALPTDGEPGPATLATWDEKGMPAPPRGWATRQDQLWDDGKDLPGARVLVPWAAGARMWFPRKDRLWTCSGNSWVLWELSGGQWRRSATAAGTLYAQPPLQMGVIVAERDKKGKEAPSQRRTSPLDQADWRPVPPDAPPWPAYDPAWTWWSPSLAASAWDVRWGDAGSLPKERQREALVKALRPDWITAKGLRVSVRGWLPNGPEVAVREETETAWVWVGDRALLERLLPTRRLLLVKKALKLS